MTHTVCMCTQPVSTCFVMCVVCVLSGSANGTRAQPAGGCLLQSGSLQQEAREDGLLRPVAARRL